MKSSEADWHFHSSISKMEIGYSFYSHKHTKKTPNLNVCSFNMALTADVNTALTV